MERLAPSPAASGSPMVRPPARVSLASESDNSPPENPEPSMPLALLERDSSSSERASSPLPLVALMPESSMAMLSPVRRPSGPRGAKRTPLRLLRFDSREKERGSSPPRVRTMPSSAIFPETSAAIRSSPESEKGARSTLKDLPLRLVSPAAPGRLASRRESLTEIGPRASPACPPSPLPDGSTMLNPALESPSDWSVTAAPPPPRAESPPAWPSRSSDREARLSVTDSRISWEASVSVSSAALLPPPAPIPSPVTSA